MRERSPSGLGVSVVVPTFRRPLQLQNCLGALLHQTQRAAQLVAVVRRGDDESARVVDAHGPGVERVDVNEPGVLAALAAGIRRATGDIIAFTDDDAVPHRDWLATLAGHFHDLEVGAVGGRDIQPGEPGPETAVVGRVTGWGKLVGNHHLGIGPPRSVDVLKGVNMAFRKAALTLPVDLRGQGAQPHFEVALCLSAQRQGWRLIYDPAARVDHYPGPRFDADHRERPDSVAVEDAAFNLVLATLRFRPELWWRRAAYGLLLGDRSAPGLGRAGLGLVRGDRSLVLAALPSLRGQIAALARSRPRVGVAST